MIGIFIGIAAVVSLISLGQGLQTAITSQFSSLSVDKLTIQNVGTGFGPPGSTSVDKLDDHDLKVIESVSGIEYVISRWIRIGQIEYNRYNGFDYVTNVPEDSVKAKIFYESMNLNVEEGRLLKSSDSGKVVLGSGAIKKEKFGKEIHAGKTIKIQGDEFEVVGILEKSGNIQFNSIVLIMEDDLKELLDIGDEIDLIIVQVEEPDEIEEIAESLKKALRRDRGLDKGEEDFSVETPLESISAVNSILSAINIIVTGIAMISLIVGGVGIANTMYTSVLERKKEIGTMKAIGARNSDILTVFLLESGFMGLVGGIIGALIGIGSAFVVALVANNFFGSQIIVVNASLPLLSFAIGFSFFIGIISGAIPSYQASKLKPVEALKG